MAMLPCSGPETPGGASGDSDHEASQDVVDVSVFYYEDSAPKSPSKKKVRIGRNGEEKFKLYSKCVQLFLHGCENLV